MKDWVLVTRTDEQIEDLRRALAVHGLDTLAYPVLQEVDHDDEHAWSELSRRLTEISLLALTSPRAALPLLQGARRRGLWDSLSALPAAVIGHATAAAAAAAGLTVAVVGHGGGAVLAALVNDH